MRNLIDEFERRSSDINRRSDKENVYSRNGTAHPSPNKFHSLKNSVEMAIEDLDAEKNEAVVSALKEDLRSLRQEFSSLKMKFEKVNDEKARVLQENTLLKTKFLAQGNNSNKIKELQEQNESLVQDKLKLGRIIKKLEKKAEERKKNLKQLFELLTEREKELEKLKDATVYASVKGRPVQVEDLIRSREKDMQAKLQQIEYRLKIKENELNDLYEAFEVLSARVRMPLHTEKELERMLTGPTSSTRDLVIF